MHKIPHMGFWTHPMVMMMMVVIANLIVKKLGDIVVESRDHAVPLLVPIEVLIKVVFVLLWIQKFLFITNRVWTNHVKDHPYIDPKSGELRVTTPLCKVNILKMKKIKAIKGWSLISRGKKKFTWKSMSLTNWLISGWIGTVRVSCSTLLNSTVRNLWRWWSQ